MKTRLGGKFGKNHSTFTDGAVVIADISNSCPYVTRVIHGKISLPRRSSGSSRRVKVVPDGHALRVSVTANASHQEMRLYTDNTAATCSWMKDRVEGAGFKFVDATQQ